MDEVEGRKTTAVDVASDPTMDCNKKVYTLENLMH